MSIFYFFFLGFLGEGGSSAFSWLLCRKDFIISGERRPFRYCRAFFPAYLSSALLIWRIFFFLFEGQRTAAFHNATPTPLNLLAATTAPQPHDSSNTNTSNTSSSNSLSLSLTPILLQYLGRSRPSPAKQHLTLLRHRRHSNPTSPLTPQQPPKNRRPILLQLLDRTRRLPKPRRKRSLASRRSRPHFPSQQHTKIRRFLGMDSGSL